MNMLKDSILLRSNRLEKLVGITVNHLNGKGIRLIVNRTQEDKAGVVANEFR